MKHLLVIEDGNEYTEFSRGVLWATEYCGFGGAVIRMSSVALRGWMKAHRG